MNPFEKAIDDQIQDLHKKIDLLAKTIKPMKYGEQAEVLRELRKEIMDGIAYLKNRPRDLKKSSHHTSSGF